LRTSLGPQYPNPATPIRITDSPLILGNRRWR
jgi:hypothetical protein